MFRSRFDLVNRRRMSDSATLWPESRYHFKLHGDLRLKFRRGRETCAERAVSASFPRSCAHRTTQVLIEKKSFQPECFPCTGQIVDSLESDPNGFWKTSHHKEHEELKGYPLKRSYPQALAHSSPNGAVLCQPRVKRFRASARIRVTLGLDKNRNQEPQRGGPNFQR